MGRNRLFDRSRCERRADLAFLGGFQLVTERAVIAALEAAFFSLTLPGFNQVLETSGTLNSRFAALSASLVSLHAQLVFALPRNRQIRELVFYAFSHSVPFLGILARFPGFIFTFVNNRPTDPHSVRFFKFGKGKQN